MTNPKFNYKLVEIDLSKSKGHDHPDIDDKHFYMAEVFSYLRFGKFTKQWYGWNFDCGWGNCGMQFDAPGTNASTWKRLWKVIRVKTKKKVSNPSIA